MTQGDYVLVPREILRGLVEFARNAGVSHHIIPDDYSESHCDDRLKAMDECETALRKIAETRYSERAEPFDDALDIADAALARLSSAREKVKL